VPVDGARDADRKPLDSARKRSPIFGLRNQVQVIALHREVYQRKAEVLLSVRERLAHHREE